MEDSPEDLPKQPPRRTAARPFFSPRPNSGEGVTGPMELSRRRAQQLFTPPTSSPATPAADTAPALELEQASELAEVPTSPAADGSTETASIAPVTDIEKEPDFEGDWTPAPLLLPEQTLDAESLLATDREEEEGHFVVEQFEQEDIELRAASPDMTDEHAIEVIAYDDANSLLQAAAIPGENPEIDGLQLESTEFSFEQAAAPQRLNIDSFWASEPFANSDTRADAEAHATPAQTAEPIADETESRIDEETAGEGEPAPAVKSEGTDPSIDEQPFEWADDPSTMISHAQAALEPEPEHDPAPVSTSAPELSHADIAPPWMSRLTPASTQALEQIKESEPWDLTPAHGQEEIAEAAPSPKAALEPEAHDVADALERIAARVRDGEIDVASGSDLSDEAALSAVLTALLRSRR